MKTGDYFKSVHDYFSFQINHYQNRKVIVVENTFFMNE